MVADQNGDLLFGAVSFVPTADMVTAKSARR
jgi:hypothetical protein